MRAGILIVGSLLWDSSVQRVKWRQERLLVKRGVPVRIPICYGRRSSSRGNTYTMVFDRRVRPGGQAFLVPCAKTVNDIADLEDEALALWAAERKALEVDGVGSKWGCVGIAFHSVRAKTLVEGWKTFFRGSRAQATWPVDEEGVVQLAWPSYAGKERLDLILTTATAPLGDPSIAAVATAWINQLDGHEQYFFKNIEHGIRTPDDLTIWRLIEQAHPGWRPEEKFPRAVEFLRAEALHRTTPIEVNHRSLL